MTYFLHFISNRYACSIPDPDQEEMVITGGRLSLTRVSVYNESGWQRDLAQLRQGRYYHACSSFTQAGDKVIFIVKLLIF